MPRRPGLQRFIIVEKIIPKFIHYQRGDMTYIYSDVEDLGLNWWTKKKIPPGSYRLVLERVG